MRPSVLRLGLGGAIAALVALSVPAAAQCPAPDGLSGPCCAPTLPNLPSFPSINIEGLGICWDNCALSSSDCVSIITSPFLPSGCAKFEAQISIADCSGAPLMSGFPLVLDYTRTWRETDDTGAQWQVWRFAAKVDLGPGTGTACVVPPCIGATAYPTAYFYGYVDMARPCSGGPFQPSIVLFHNCDSFIHSPAHSDKPGVFHPDSTYAIVGPDTAANPFSPTPVLRPDGALFGEAFRNAPPPPSICLTEERLGAGFLIKLLQLCACPLAFGNIQQSVNLLRAEGTCIGPDGLPSSAESLDTTPFGFPWFHMLTTSIGSWTTGASYPGPEAAFVDEGVFFWHDSCNVAPPLSTGNSLDFLYGGSTDGGWDAEPDFGIVVDGFVDLASNFSRDLPGPIVPPFTGSVIPTRHLLYTNHL